MFLSYFSTDEDARQAMMKDGGKIKEMKVKLLLSSRTEMQKVIETARQQTLNLQNAFMQAPAVVVPTPAVTKPNESSSGNGNDSEKDRKSRRSDRSRSRERSRSRDRDRDRDRRDRDRGRDRRGGGGRRDRSRSRDRGDRDRRDRNRRRRDRSRSRDRTRSRDRDGKRARKDNNDEDTGNDVVCVGQFSKDKIGPGKGGHNKNPNMPENGIWEVPPQNQIQAAALMPSLLTAVAASVMPQDGDQRSGPFGMNQGPMISGQFGMNGINGVGNMLSSQLGMSNSTSNIPPLTGPGSMNNRNNRESWNDRMDNGRFNSRSGGFPLESNYGPNNGNMGGNFRGQNMKQQQNNPFLNKMQELDSRRNPNAFQSSQGSFNNGADRSRINARDNRDARDMRGDRDGRDMRDNRDGRDMRDNRDGRDMRDNRDGRDMRDNRDGRDMRDNRDGRDMRDRDNRDMRNNRDRDGRDRNRDRDNRDNKDANDTRGNSRFTDNDKPAGYCVEVRNMPLNANYNDLRHTFKGLYIRNEGIKLITDTQGNRVGIAYVKFGSFESKEQALKGLKYVRGSEVEILPLDESIFDKTNSSFEKSPDKPSKQDKNDNSKSENSMSSTCVILSDLPSFVKEIEIAKLFQDWKINDLFITNRKDSHGIQYLAYVQFARLEDAKLAVSKPQKMGNKLVTVTSISEMNFEKAKIDHEQTSSGLGMNSLSSDVGVNFDCVIMRGLPYHTQERDILDFFTDIGLVPSRIHMLLNHSGKPAGECFCEFNSCEDAVRATAKNGLPLGKNIPSIELVNRNKMMETLGMAEGKIMDGHHHPHHYQGMQDGRPRFPPMHHPGRYGGGPGGPYGMRGPGPMGPMGMPPRHLMPRHPPVAPPSQGGHVEGFGKPGCVLSLENVPFKAEIDEIIEFFGDFNLLRENVIRRYNDKGMPTGDAKVAFSSPSEARRAYEELRNCKIRDRTIFMKLA